MPRKSLHGRTRGVSRDGGRARALQQTRRSAALQRMPRSSASHQTNVKSFSAVPNPQSGAYRAGTAPHQRVPAFNHSRKRLLSNGHPNSRPTASRSTGTRSP
ncbi:hypothetical protein E1J24_17105 [Xanthomonas hortorum pv. pelargonii]|uniref:Uncharacterized protein n=1 Tax=Xanthomonas hortorum pv. pelargonii TaxID=453602 RepID=A0AAW9ZU13_9XANT|nr:hypothetical protein [Xanthomonas hortorum pv. pelargonii]